MLFRMLVMALIAVSATAKSQTTGCELTNDELERMDAIKVTFTRANGEQLEINGLLADDVSERAAGFQNICPERIRQTAILFKFSSLVKPSFHMNNVMAPLEIAFIDEQGRIDRLHKMKTYSVVSKEKPVYGPDNPIIAALEVYEGFFADHDLTRTAKVSWQMESLDKTIKQKNTND